MAIGKATPLNTSDAPLKIILKDTMQMYKPPPFQALFKLPLGKHFVVPGEELKNRIATAQKCIPMTEKVRLWLKRSQSANGAMFLVSIEREEPIQPYILMAIRIRIQNGSRYYDFWADDNESNLQRVLESYLGSSKSNLFGNSYTVYIPSGNNEDIDIEQQEPRKHLCSVIVTFKRGASKSIEYESLVVLGSQSTGKDPENLGVLHNSTKQEFASRWNDRRTKPLEDLLYLENLAILPFPDLGMSKQPGDPKGSLQMQVRKARVYPLPKIDDGKKKRPTAKKGKKVKKPPTPPPEEEIPPCLLIERVEDDTFMIEMTYPLSPFMGMQITMIAIEKTSKDFIGISKTCESTESPIVDYIDKKAIDELLQTPEDP